MRMNLMKSWLCRLLVRRLRLEMTGDGQRKEVHDVPSRAKRWADDFVSLKSDKSVLMLRLTHQFAWKCRVFSIPTTGMTVAPSWVNQRGASVFTRKMGHSTSASPFNLAYVGPSGAALKILKRVSITSLGVIMLITPLMTLVDFERIPPAVVASVTVSALITSALSTGLVTWFSKPYILKAFHHANSPRPIATFETLNLFSKPVYSTVYCDSLQKTEKHFKTWQVNPTQSADLAELERAHTAFLQWVQTKPTIGDYTMLPPGNAKQSRNEFYCLDDPAAAQPNQESAWNAILSSVNSGATQSS